MTGSNKEVLYELARRSVEESRLVKARTFEALGEKIVRAAELTAETLRGGGKVLWCGNGGSAADAQHLAAELVGRFVRDRKALASIALTVDTSILTAVGNDYGYDRVFARQAEALTKPGDLLFAISTSGSSPNVLAAIETAARLGGKTVGLTGETGGEMAGRVDLLLNVPSRTTARIQETHILIGHLICELSEEILRDDLFGA